MNLETLQPTIQLKSQTLKLKVDGPTPNLLRVTSSGPRGEQGERGEQGLPPDISRYKRQLISSVDGRLEIDAALASTYVVMLTENVTEIVYKNWPVDTESQRIALYFMQMSDGECTVTGWPSITMWPGGFEPEISRGVHVIDCIVIDLFDGGNTIFGNLVGRNYRPKV